MEYENVTKKVVLFIESIQQIAKKNFNMRPFLST
jgi:hypothetical protein